MSRMRFTAPSLLRVSVLALVAGLLPLGTAFAQSQPRVRVTSSEATVKLMRTAKSQVITTVTQGTVLPLIYTSGDLYAHRDTNWYMVLLPRDAYGRRHSGWISGRNVEELPPAAPESAPAPEPAPVVQPPAQPVAQPEAPPAPQPVASALPAMATDRPDELLGAADAKRPDPFEVVVHFAFDKSDLTVEAKQTLDGGVKQMETSGAGGMTFAVEGHADSTGPNAYNDRLGLARAEAVKRYLAEQHHIPANRITVVSYGETRPAVSNATREGRATNRRVVVKVGDQVL
ncbi:MAG: OmpA family protein [Vicinamibacterales bacterium]